MHLVAWSYNAEPSANAEAPTLRKRTRGLPSASCTPFESVHRPGRYNHNPCV